MMTYLLVAFGGALGSVARHWLSLALSERGAMMLPLGTLVVNVIGSLLIGFAFALLKTRYAMNAEGLRAFIMVGLLGGFTTFSAFSLDTLRLLEAGFWYWALLNIVLSVVGCVLAAFIGLGAGAIMIKNM